LDQRLGKASGKQVPADLADEVNALYRKRYQGFHLHEHPAPDAPAPKHPLAHRKQLRRLLLVELRFARNDSLEIYQCGSTSDGAPLAMPLS
jgi:hypothetical protein